MRENFSITKGCVLSELNLLGPKHMLKAFCSDLHKMPSTYAKYLQPMLSARAIHRRNDL